MNGLPRSDFIREGIELEFGFYFAVNGSTGGLFGQITGIYNYTVGVRQENPANANELIAVIRDINYTPNRIQRLTVNDLSALQLPFLIEIHKGGELNRIITTSKETRSSLKMKSNLLDLLVYNQDKASKQLNALVFRKKTQQTELEQTPLGNCLANVTGMPINSSYVILSNTERALCEGPVQFSKILDRRKLKVSDESWLELRVEIDKRFKELKRASMKTKLQFNAERASQKRNTGFGHVRIGIDISHRLEYLRAIKFKKTISTAQFRVSFIVILYLKIMPR